MCQVSAHYVNCITSSLFIIQQIFIEHLLCVRCILGTKNKAINKTSSSLSWNLHSSGRHRNYTCTWKPEHRVRECQGVREGNSKCPCLNVDWSRMASVIGNMWAKTKRKWESNSCLHLGKSVGSWSGISKKGECRVTGRWGGGEWVPLEGLCLVFGWDGMTPEDSKEDESSFISIVIQGGGHITYIF